MTVETRRGCGYRKVGGMYLIGGSFFLPCDRLPLPLRICPVCGGGIKVGRSFTEINPYALWRDHKPDCDDKIGKCPVCLPTTAPAFIMLVGERFYPTPLSFITEGLALGISKRIPFVPKKLKLGETVIYLAHPKACKLIIPAELQRQLIAEPIEGEPPRLLKAEQVEPELGIFATFVPTSIERLFWESDKDKVEVIDCERRGITPVFIPDGDWDHAPPERGDIE